MKNNNKKIPIILDVDTGIDDAVAIMLACKSELLDIKMICSCNGNTTAKQSAINTCKILDFLDEKQIPILQGKEAGFVKTRNKIRGIHGGDGLGDYNFPKTKRKIIAKNYLDVYEKTILENEKISICVLGPLTNIAKLLEKNSKLQEHIKEIVFMGSSLTQYAENEVPYAGFNVACDPEATEKVLSSGIKLIFCPNDIGKNCYLTPDELKKMENTNSTGKILAQIFKNYKDRQVVNGVAMYDSTTIYYFFNQKDVEIKPVNIEIKYYDELNTGVALANFEKPQNAFMITHIDCAKFKKFCFKLLKKCK